MTNQYKNTRNQNELMKKEGEKKNNSIRQIGKVILLETQMKPRSLIQSLDLKVQKNLMAKKKKTEV